MKTTKGKQGSYTILGILLVASALSINSIVSPILSEINASYPEVSNSQIQIIYSIVGLAGIPIVLLGGKLSYKINKKLIIFCAFILMISGGVLGFFGYRSLTMLYIASAITGAGISLGQAMLFSIIAISFNEEGRARWGGIAGVVFSIAGSIYTIVSGTLAERNGWQFSYLIILWLIPVCLLAMKFIPKKLSAEKTSHETGLNNSKKGVSFVTFRYIFYILLGFLATIAFIAYNTNISSFTVKMGFGGAIVAGRVSSLFMLAGIPAGFLCGAIFKKTKNHYMSFAAFLFCLGFAVCALSKSLMMLSIGSAIVGFANGIRVPGNTVVLGGMLDAEDAAFGIGIYNSISMLGGFISPYLISFFTGLRGNNPRSPFLVCVILLVFMTVGHIIDGEVLVPRHNSSH